MATKLKKPRTFQAKDGERIAVNAHGGAGSDIPWWQLLDFRALDLMAERATKGAKKYARDNWRAVSWEENIAHAVRHAYAAMEPVQQQRSLSDPEVRVLVKDELSGFICRAMMAVAVFLQDEGVESKVPTGLACNDVDSEDANDANEDDDR